jgi:hypothetical protein
MKIIIDTDEIIHMIQNRLFRWRRLRDKPPLVWIDAFINNLYIRHYQKRGPILESKDRYELQKLLGAEDPESTMLGLALLSNYSTGNDELRSCSFRMTYSSDYEIANFPEKVLWLRIGDIQLYHHIRIQVFIDKIKEIYNNEEYTPAKILKECSKYLRPIEYYFAYHPRIGSNTCNNHEAIKYPDGKSLKLPEVNDRSWKDIYRWNWKHRGWFYPISASEYWKFHKKPEF